MTIFYVGGSKGGVGKTLVAFSLADHLLKQRKPFAIVETDSANPDFAAAFSKAQRPPPILHLTLDSEAAWRDLLAFAMQHKDHDVILNSAAGGITFIREHGAAFEAALIANNQQLVTLWPINMERDSLMALRQYLEVMTFRVHPIRNLHYGDAHEFYLFNESEMKRELDTKGHHTINLPALAQRCAVQLRNSRLTLAVAQNAMSLLNRCELFRWRFACHQQFSEIIP